MVCAEPVEFFAVNVEAVLLPMSTCPKSTHGHAANCAMCSTGPSSAPIPAGSSRRTDSSSGCSAAAGSLAKVGGVSRTSACSAGGDSGHT